MLRPEQLRIDRVVQRDGDEATMAGAGSLFRRDFRLLITICLIGTTSADEPPFTVGARP